LDFFTSQLLFFDACLDEIVLDLEVDLDLDFSGLWTLIGGGDFEGNLSVFITGRSS